MITEVKNVTGEKIAARNVGSFERTFEAEMPDFKAIVLSLVHIEPKGYNAQLRLCVEAGGKKYKVSQWSECEVGEEVMIRSKEFTIKQDGKEDLVRYYLVAETISGPTQ